MGLYGEKKEKNQINIKDIIENKALLSPLNHKKVVLANKNYKLIRELTGDKLTKGEEIGSDSYISKSHKYFIRNKSLQREHYLPYFTNDSVVPILPDRFKNLKLREGDLIISKDSNIGETVILDKDYPNHMLSGGMYKLSVKGNKYYLLSFLKHEFFREQLNFLISKGATIRHAKSMFLDCKIPFPNQDNAKDVIRYIEILTQAIIKKEIEIKEKDNLIQEKIFNELVQNQKKNRFIYKMPDIEEIKAINRINSGIYSEYFKQQEFLIKNYKKGYKNIYEMGFKISRGQNLQVSCIGESLYSNEYRENFYTLMLPKNITYYGTVKKYLYLGNKNKLKTLKSGDIVFGAEGFEKGRSIVVFKEDNKTITNIHGITLNHENRNINLSIFIKCFLDYLRKTGLIDIYAVGGNGGSLAQGYWDVIPFPDFPDSLKEEISKLYFNPVKYNENLTLDNFLEKDITKESGIIQLSEQIEIIKHVIDDVFNQIIKNKNVKIKFDFVKLL